MKTLDSIKQIVAKQLGRDPSEFDVDTDLEEAGYDSIDVLETIFALEEAFQIALPFDANDRDAMMGMKTVGDIMKMVETLLVSRRPE